MEESWTVGMTRIKMKKWHVKMRRATKTDRDMADKRVASRCQREGDEYRNERLMILNHRVQFCYSVGLSRVELEIEIALLY